MKITNKHNLPESIYNAIVNDDYVKVGDYSATSLIKPYQMLALERKHADEIETDASDMLWMLLGKAMHHILETGNHANSIIESRLQVTVGDIVLSAKPDLYHIADKSIDDYKVTSAYSFILGDKPEWEQQLNINAFIYQENGFPVEQLRIYAILRDHMKSKALSDRDYPQIPFQTVPIALWEFHNIRTFIEDRIQGHEQSKEDPNFIRCSNAERWYKGSQWAVMKEGRKSALRVFDTEKEADDLLLTLDSKHSKIERKGAYVRCEGYCNASKFCEQYKNSQIKEGV